MQNRTKMLKTIEIITEHVFAINKHTPFVDFVNNSQSAYYAMSSTSREQLQTHLFAVHKSRFQPTPRGNRNITRTGGNYPSDCQPMIIRKQFHSHTNAYPI